MMLLNPPSFSYTLWPFKAHSINIWRYDGISNAPGKLICPGIHKTRCYQNLHHEQL